MKSTTNISKNLQESFKISDICNVIKGNTPTMKAVPGKYPLVVTAENRKTCENYQFDCEAVCVPLVSSTGHGHADIKRIHYQNGKFALANIMVAIIPKDYKNISTKYLYHLLNIKKNEMLVSLMRGTANVTIKIPQIENIIIPLPSLNEQKMIISKLEKSNKEFIFAKQVLQELLVNLEHYKKSFLSYALIGKQYEKLDNSKISEKISIPKGWTVKKTSDITKVYSGGTPKRVNLEYWENGNVPWLRSGDLKNNIITKAVEFITDKGLKESSAKLWPKNSVVVALTGANTGKIGILDFECCGNQSIVGILPNEIILPKYLWYYMQYSYGYFWSKAMGGAQSHINGKIVLEREILFPENKEIQKKIIQKLDQEFNQIKNSQEILKSQISLLERLRWSLFEKYF